MERAFDLGVLEQASPAGVRPTRLHLARSAAAAAAARMDPATCSVVMAAVADVEDAAFRWGAVAGALAVLECARSRKDLEQVVLRAAELVGDAALGVIDLRRTAEGDEEIGAPRGGANGTERVGGRNWT